MVRNFFLGRASFHVAGKKLKKWSKISAIIAKIIVALLPAKFRVEDFWYFYLPVPLHSCPTIPLTHAEENIGLDFYFVYFSTPPPHEMSGSAAA